MVKLQTIALALAISDHKHHHVPVWVDEPARRLLIVDLGFERICGRRRDNVKAFDRLPVSEFCRQVLVDIEHVVGARHQVVRRHHNREQHCPQHRHAGQKDIGGTRHFPLLRPRTPRAAVNIIAQPAPRNGGVVTVVSSPSKQSRPVNLS